MHPFENSALKGRRKNGHDLGAASLYKKDGVWYISYKNEAGKWKGKSTGYRVGNLGETRQAKPLCERQSRVQRERDEDAGDSRFDRWVDAWMQTRYGDRPNTTLATYQRCWRKLRAWLDQSGLDRPGQVTYAHVQSYLGWRLRHGGKKNTAIADLKFLGVVLGEALKRGYCTANPARQLGLRKDAAKEKVPWNTDEVRRVGELLHRELWGQWPHVVFLLGLHQAARLRQCAVPLDAIDLRSGVIHWPAGIMKGARPHSQPIDPELARIIDARRQAGHRTLCDLPQFPSIEFRQLLDSLGLQHLVHHGLRVTLVTNMAKGGVPIAQAMRFVGHSGLSVHQIYIKLGASDLLGVFDRIRAAKGQ